MKSKRIFIVADTLRTGSIECRMATVTPKGEAIVGSGMEKKVLHSDNFATTWDEAKVKAETMRAERCAELQAELDLLQSTTFQRVGG
jgi:hypothetical protein